MLVFQNLKRFLLKNKLLFGLFVSLLFINICGMLFVSNFLTSINKWRASEYQKSFVFTIDSANNIEIGEEMDEIVEKYGYVIESIRATFFDSTTEKYIAAFSYRNDKYARQNAKFGRLLTNEDFKEGKQVTVVPAYLSSHAEDPNNEKIDENSEIFGQKFLIVGTHLGDPIYQIPYSTIPKDLPVETIEVIMLTKMSASEADSLGNSIKQILEARDVTLPPMSSVMEPDTLLEYFLITCGFVAGFLNFSFLYRAIMEKRKKQHAIFRICGASKLKTIMIGLFEVMILSTIVYLISSFLFRFGFMEQFKVLKEFYYQTTLIKYYFQLYFVQIGLLVIILVPVMIKFVKKSPIELLYNI